MSGTPRLIRRRHDAAGLGDAPRDRAAAAHRGGTGARSRSTGAGLLVLALCVGTASAGRADVAPPGASACSGCHGPAAGPSVGPSIAGRPAAETVALMEEFRSGARAGTVMPRIAKGFTAQETQAIAAWWASAAAGTKP